MELYQRNGVVVNTTENRGAREEFVEEDLKCLEGQPRFLFPEPKNNETPLPLPSPSRKGRFCEAQGCEGQEVEGTG